MPNAQRVDERISHQDAVRPLVLLVIDDAAMTATIAYELTASGFDVAMSDAAARRDITGRRPDIVLAALDGESGATGLSDRILGRDPRVRGVPIVAIAADVGAATRTRARRAGCAAVCLETCGGAALALGLRAVLDRGGG
jgi:DNA-binding response OmpR family regulator